MSILFTATTIGTSAARAWEIDSFVCGMTPSSAATTSTAMSVTFAPRARMAVNASWPGVSRNVIRRPSTSAWYAPMCCVIPPASVSTTDVSRIASRSVVLPWSTWPMIVTTGGRGDEVGLVVVVLRRLELLLGRVLDRDLALELGADDLDLLVGERLRRRPHLAEAHEDLDQLGHRDAERLGEVLDRYAGLDRGRPGRRAGRRLARLRRCGTAIARLAPGAAASAALDDDAPLAPSGAAAGANGAIRSLASVSHERSV